MLEAKIEYGQFLGRTCLYYDRTRTLCGIESGLGV